MSFYREATNTTKKRDTTISATGALLIIAAENRHASGIRANEATAAPPSRKPEKERIRSGCIPGWFMIAGCIRYDCIIPG
jgi:hypothetical protein